MDILTGIDKLHQLPFNNASRYRWFILTAAERLITDSKCRKNSAIKKRKCSDIGDGARKRLKQYESATILNDQNNQLHEQFTASQINLNVLQSNNGKLNVSKSMKPSTPKYLAPGIESNVYKNANGSSSTTTTSVFDRPYKKNDDVDQGPRLRLSTEARDLDVVEAELGPSTKKDRQTTPSESTEFDDLDDDVFDELVCEHEFSPSSCTSPLHTRLPYSEHNQTPCYQSAGSTSPSSELDKIETTSGTRDQLMKPFLRSSYPELIDIELSESPAPCLKASSRVTTCFRIAEALRLLHQSLQLEKGTRIELFAVVHASWEDRNVQCLIFADMLFPHRPPYLTGRFRTSSISDKDISSSAGTFESRNTDTSQHELVRVIIQTKNQATRNDTSTSANLMPDLTGRQTPQLQKFTHVDVLDIRDSDWDEVDYVRGIVDPPVPDKSVSSPQDVLHPDVNRTSLQAVCRSGDQKVVRVHDAWNEWLTT